MRERIKWIDSVKGLAMFSVVLCHVVNGYYESTLFADAGDTLYAIQNILNSYQMAMFCMMSGFLFHKAYVDKNGDIKKANLKRQIFNLISIYIVWCIIMGIFKIALNGSVNNEVSIKDLLLIWCKPIGVYWYLYVLVFLYLIFQNSVMHIIKDKYLIVFFGIVGIIGSLLSDDFFGGYFFIRRILYYSFIFYLGILLSKKYASRINKWFAIICGVVAVVLILLFWNNEVEIYHIRLINLIVATGICLFVIWFFCIIPADFKILQFIGKNSLDIYLLHVFITAGSRMVIAKIETSDVWICVIVTLTIALFFPIMIGKILKALGIYEWFFKPYIAISGIIKKRN